LRLKGNRMLDLLINNLWIIDGSGKAGFRGEVAVRDEKIVIRQPGEGARRTVSGEGLTVCPGFIDAHSHGDQAFGTEYGNLCKTSQGITTEVTGHCGATAFPASERQDRFKMLLENAPYALLIYGSESVHSFTRFENYLACVSKMEHTTNYLQLMGHGALRIAAMGFDDRPPTQAELACMQCMLEDAMEHGAVGMSSGLLYSPSGYADTNELAALCSTVKRYNGVYATHMRNEAGGVVESVQEALDVAMESGVRLNISHHKICGQKNWGLSETTLAMMESAAGTLSDIWTDTYPYASSCSQLNVCLPKEYFASGPEAVRELLSSPNCRAECARRMEEMDGRYNHCGGFGGILIVSAPGVPESEGLTVAEYAKRIQKSPFDAFFDLVSTCGFETYAIFFAMDEKDLCRIAAYPRTLIATDGIAPVLGGKTHPRGFAAFPKAIDLFWRQKQLMPLEALIKKMTFETARHFMISGKGLIAPGYNADLVVFDAERIRDAADYLHPAKLCDGIELVINGGKVVYENKRLTGEAPGRFVPHRNSAKA